MDKNNETFEYTYSAEQQAEIEKIRSKYMPKEETKLDQLRKLDASVTVPGTIAGLVIGIVGILTFGSGMSCTLVGGASLFILGIILGLLGIILMIAAFPVYKKITAKKRERIAPQILALTDELVQ